MPFFYRPIPMPQSGLARSDKPSRKSLTLTKSTKGLGCSQLLTRQNLSVRRRDENHLMVSRSLAWHSGVPGPRYQIVLRGNNGATNGPRDKNRLGGRARSGPELERSGRTSRLHSTNGEAHSTDERTRRLGSRRKG